MTNLSTNVHCDTFKGVRVVSPLLHAFEFMSIVGNGTSEYDFLKEYAKNKAWDFDLNMVLDFIKLRENTVVITCPNEKIQWVNKGFTRMTGYGFNEAVGKSPNFLQGKETSLVTRQLIRERLNLRAPFSGQVINYRKDGGAYVCRVDILPVFNQDKVLSNFIALEHELV
ncbi:MULTISPECIES: PAS domain-containing protein [unclassified Arcicella]|uniref:PAS domain-containing protein n=1 Tax=unclassified Arcicella TaxID=2644986 RepID=UPI002856CA5B|nr:MULTISPECIES: PAS domain-containing protein [unclassified Arcicella]MDR6561328.1 PAS domain S-box-containing protein [Arcicella sp. BE51]MDR6811212.1 PAS domain S-box-containing protein [Arcicella sp. BE140]MDR6822562.1 PAS domain S-box-containing protein [Arcicella sp. BE139]